MTTKMLALIAGVLSTAFGQIKNICLGAEPDGPSDTPAPKKGKSKPAPEKEVEEEEETEVAVETEDEDETDYDDLREKTKKNVIKIYMPKDQGGLGREDLKPKIKALIVKAGVGSITELPDDKVEPFIEAVKKLVKGGK